MLDSDITLNSLAQTPAGTNAALVVSRLHTQNGESVYAAASLALTNPAQLRVAHSVRKVTGLTLVTDASRSAGPMLIDRHLIRFDKNKAQTKVNDPEAKLNASIQIVIEVPRLGSESPTVTNISDQLKCLANYLTASTDANLVRILNREV